MTRTLRFSIGALLVAALAAQTPALRKGVSVQMPVTTSAAAMPDADLADSLVVAVTLRGTVYLEVTNVTPAQLTAKLQEQLAGHAGRRVYLKSDARTPYSTVSGVLEALRLAGVDAPVLLTSQREPANLLYTPPMGLEVLLTPPTGGAVQSTRAPESELRQRARRDGAVVLQADGTAPFGDVVHAADVCRGEGAKVYLAAPGK